MKKTILTLTMITFSQLSTAGLVSGAQTLHTLNCASKIIPTIGLQVGLKVITQALAPQDNVRGMILITKAVLASNSKVKAKETVLKLDNQNAYYATCKAKDVKVVLDKTTFVATLENGAIEYSCK